MTRKEKIAEELARAKERRAALDKRIEELEQKLIEAENSEIIGIVRDADLSAEELSAAVRTFIGTVAKMALMRRAFSEMTDAEKGDYEDSLRTVETWIRDARRALEAATFQGVTVR